MQIEWRATTCTHYAWYGFAIRLYSRHMNNPVHTPHGDYQKAADNNLICVFTGLLLVTFAFNDIPVEKG